MAKIYNIKSDTLSFEDLEEIRDKLNDNEDIIMLNEDIRYEIIDFDKMTALKSEKPMFSLINFFNVFKKK